MDHPRGQTPVEGVKYDRESERFVNGFEKYGGVLHTDFTRF